MDLLNEKTKNELTAEQQNDLLDTDKFNENNKSSGHNPISLSENIIINNVSPLPENVTIQYTFICIYIFLFISKRIVQVSAYNLIIIELFIFVGFMSL